MKSAKTEFIIASFLAWLFITGISLIVYLAEPTPEEKEKGERELYACYLRCYDNSISFEQFRVERANGNPSLYSKPKTYR
jgi:hypothetical protein